MRNVMMLFLLSLLVSGAVVAEPATDRTLFEVARPAFRPPAAPRYSDVCLSSRWRHPRNDSDPHDTFRDAAAFHATRLDWVYSFDPAWIQECRERGFHFGGALNTILTDAPGVGTREKGRILDKENNRVAAPWMTSWNGYWGCVNSPEYRETYLVHAKRLVDGGVDVIQMDDPGINLGATQWGGCFCEYCRAQAEAQGLNLNTDMGKFQHASVVAFYQDMRAAIDVYAGRHVPFSSNNYGGRFGFPYTLFEYGMAELHENKTTPDLLYKTFKEARDRKFAQIFTLVTGDVALTRKGIATAYAAGGHVLAPYDVYHGSNPRIFGDPKDAADLYGFVRANAHYLDGYEDAAVCGKGVRESRYGGAQPLQLSAEGVYAFCRVRPNAPEAPIVIHLVDWRETPAPFRISLKRAYGFAAAQAGLLAPPPYDPELHAQAEATKDFTALSATQSLKVDIETDGISIDIPPVTPWGMLILTTE